MPLTKEEALEQLNAYVQEMEAPKPDAELERLQGESSQRRALGAMAQAGGSFADAFTSPGRRTSSTPFWDRYNEASEEPVLAYRAKQKQLADYSEQKRRAQESVGKLALDVEQEKRTAAEKAADQAQRGKQFEAEQTEKQRQYDLSVSEKASGKALEERRYGLSEKQAAEAARHNRAMEARELAALAQKGGDHENAAELAAPGWGRAANAPAIKREEAAGFRDAIGSHRNVTSSLGKLRAMVDQHGSELVGAKSAQMSQLSRDMLLEIKNLAKLGVLSKSDEGIIDDLVPNPGSIGGALKSKGSMQAQLEQLGQLLDQKLESKAYSLGYAKGPAEDGGLAEVSKTVGGQRYVKRGEKWFAE